ncbi:MAG TPA: ABC transporter ATP-binding protein [Jiangellales bacterium]|nr:ABC transporter ATP-binding protein [Jiangellales bacterium]
MASDLLTATETAISVRGLTKTYGDVLAVDGVDLAVRRGEVFALLGPNGAGKTTTVEILEGYRRRDAGEVSVLGADPERAGTSWRARIGIVLQTAPSAEELTVTELLGHFSTFYPRPRPVAEVVDAVGLQEKRRTRVRHLSGGQRRRLDVALGILGRPELLFLDEPTTGFDPEARREFWGLIRSLSGEGTTILLTTHYLDEAEQLADRVGVIAAGRLVAVDAPAALGGRDDAAATVRWRDEGRPYQVSTRTPTRVVRELADRFGGEVPELTVGRETLEDTYLRLIGEQR